MRSQQCVKPVNIWAVKNCWMEGSSLGNSFTAFLELFLGISLPHCWLLLPPSFRPLEPPHPCLLLHLLLLPSLIFPLGFGVHVVNSGFGISGPVHEKNDLHIFPYLSLTRIRYARAMADLLLSARGWKLVGVSSPYRFIARHKELKTRQLRRYDYKRALYKDPAVVSG